MFVLEGTGFDGRCHYRQSKESALNPTTTYAIVGSISVLVGVVCLLLAAYLYCNGTCSKVFGNRTTKTKTTNEPPMVVLLDDKDDVLPLKEERTISHVSLEETWSEKSNI